MLAAAHANTGSLCPARHFQESSMAHAPTSEAPAEPARSARAQDRRLLEYPRDGLSPSAHTGLCPAITIRPVTRLQAFFKCSRSMWILQFDFLRGDHLFLVLHTILLGDYGRTGSRARCLTAGPGGGFEPGLSRRGMGSGVGDCGGGRAGGRLMLKGP